MMSAGYARVYHRLHQLSLSGHGTDGRVPGLTLSLAALNYAEVAGGALSPSCRAETFACAALQLKQSLPDVCGWLPRLILQKGLAGLETVPASLRWLATSDGMRFFMEHKWTYEKDRSSMFASAPPASPLLYVRQVGMGPGGEGREGGDAGRSRGGGGEGKGRGEGTACTVASGPVWDGMGWSLFCRYAWSGRLRPTDNN